MISTHENLGGSKLSLAELEKLAGVFACDYQAVKSIVGDIEAELNKVKSRYLRALRRRWSLSHAKARSDS